MEKILAVIKRKSRDLGHVVFYLKKNGIQN